MTWTAYPCIDHAEFCQLIQALPSLEALHMEDQTALWQIDPGRVIDCLSYRQTEGTSSGPLPRLTQLTLNLEFTVDSYPSVPNVEAMLRSLTGGQETSSLSL